MKKQRDMRECMHGAMAMGIDGSGSVRGSKEAPGGFSSSPATTVAPNPCCPQKTKRDQGQGGAAVGFLRPPLLACSGMEEGAPLQREQTRRPRGKRRPETCTYFPSIRLGSGWAHAGFSCKNNKT